MKNLTLKEWFFVSIIVLLIGVSVYAWFFKGGNRPKGEVQGPTLPAPTSETTPSVVVPCPPPGIVTIPKEKIVEKEKIVKVWPDWFKDGTTVITADKTLPPWKGKTYVVATMNTQTGIGGISYIHLPEPYFEFKNETKISLGYILIGDKAGKMQAEITYTPFRFGQFEITGFGQVDDSARGGVRLEYRW